MLHLPAIAYEAGVELNLEIANEISAKTPNLCKLAPAGPNFIVDLYEAGGVQAVMKELSKRFIRFISANSNRKTVGENIASAVNRNHNIIRPIENPP